jgi:hypothetical protein
LIVGVYDRLSIAAVAWIGADRVLSSNIEMEVTMAVHAGFCGMAELALGGLVGMPSHAAARAIAP